MRPRTGLFYPKNKLYTLVITVLVHKTLTKGLKNYKSFQSFCLVCT